MLPALFPTFMTPYQAYSPHQAGGAWGATSHPTDMMVAGLAFWMEASRAAASMMGARAFVEPQRQSASWYREPMGVQDAASGAVGWLAGPFAAFLPAVSASAPFWSVPMPRAAAPMPVMPVMPGDPGLMDNPWSRMWANALGHESDPAQTPVRPSEGRAALPVYQSDGGHAVAHIVHAAARALIAVLPLVAVVLGMVMAIAEQMSPVV